MMNVDQITTRLSMMDDKALETFATMHKNDPYLFPLAYSESTRRQRHRAAAQARQAMPQPKVTDAAIAQMRPAPEPDMSQMAAAGIPQLAARNIETLADGGIAGYAAGGVPQAERDKYRAYALNRAKALGLDPKFVDAIFQIESEYDPTAKSKTGPVGIGQLAKKTAQALGLSPEERKDPYKNMDTSMALMKRLFDKYGDPAKVAIAYNQGEGILNEHLKKNKGRLVPEKLHENVRTANKQEPMNYLKKLNTYIPLPAAAAADTVPRGESKVATGAPAARGVAALPTLPKEPAAAPKRDQTAGLSPDLARQITSTLPIASAQAANEVPQDRRAAQPDFLDKLKQAAPPFVGGEGRLVSEVFGKGKASAPAASQTANAGLPALAQQKTQKTTPTDDVMYSPEGIPLIAPYGGPDTKAPTTALLTGTADVLLGIPEAVANVVAQDIYNMPYGKQYSWKEAREAAQNNPVVKAAGMLRSGKWFGVENDPAYQKDPLSLIASLPALGAEGVAEKFGLDKDAARLAVENAMVFAPMVGKVKQVQYNMPKLKGKEASTITPELAQNAVKQALDEVKAAERKTEAPRLGMSTGETPGVVRSTPEGQGVLPTGEAAARQKAGLAGLAEDQLALAAARRRAAEAEAVAAQSSKVPGTKSLAERFGGAPFAARAAVPYGMLSASTDVSPSFMGRGSEDDTVKAEALGSQDAGIPLSPYSAASLASAATPEEKAPAPTTEQKKAFGLDNEDLLMLGLGMLASPGGQAGSDLSQLFSNLGRSGMGAVAAKREREKLAEEKDYKNVMKKYYGKLTEMYGRPEAEERQIAQVMQEYNVDRIEAIRRIYEAKFASRGEYGLEAAKVRALGPFAGLIENGLIDPAGGDLTPAGRSVFAKYFPKS